MSNGYGFGSNSFGYFPFGHTDYGEDVVIKSFPATYLEDPSTGKVNQVLKNYLSIAQYQANKTKELIDELEDQIDPNTVREDILKYLGTTIAVDIDNYEPTEFRRSLVNNSILFYRIKGTADSFKIRGKLSGYDVEVVNIWRIDINRVVTTATDYFLAFGNGGASQSVSTTLLTFPIIENSFKLTVDGVIIGQDDGAGNVVGVGPTVITGTIDYISGDLTIIITPGVAADKEVHFDLLTGVRNLEIAQGVGGGTQVLNSSLSVSSLPYPLASSTFQMYVDSLLVAEDDGLGNVSNVLGSSYSIAGTMDYFTGFYNISITPAPAVGTSINVSYNKTLLGEFLHCHEDDVYEIPSGTGNWFVTLPPTVVAGNYSEGCGYCLTTYIKLKFIVPQGAVNRVNLNTGAENFFDRLIRKLRDITPIHVRDLLYELQMIIVIDENSNLKVENVLQEEHNWLTNSSFYRFDITPADVVSVDSHGYVTGTVELV